MEDLTLEGILHSSFWKAIRAPLAKTLRLLNAEGLLEMISHLPTFSSLQRLHIAAAVRHQDVMSLIEIYLHVLETAFVGWGNQVLESMRSMKGLRPIIKSYEYSSQSLWRMELDTYENEEVVEPGEAVV